MARKTRAELEAENRLLKANHWVTGFSKAIQVAIIWVSIAACFYFIRDIAIAWAGKETKADISVNGSATWGDVSMSPNEDAVDLCYWLSVGGIAFGWFGMMVAVRQRRLRMRTVEHLAPDKIQQERAVDPRRSSSGLLANGETRPEDV